MVRDETASEIIYLLELKCPYCMSECSRVWPEWYQMSTESATRNDMEDSYMIPSKSKSIKRRQTFMTMFF